MARLDIHRQNELEPIRVKFARESIESLGYSITNQTENLIEFEFKGSTVKIYPYSGWFTGKTVNDGRGIKNLLRQIKTKS
jgi:hypothetical protein